MIFFGENMLKTLCRALASVAVLTITATGCTPGDASRYPVTADLPSELPRPSIPYLAAETTQGDSRPNIILIVADDMRADDMKNMPKTRRLLAGTGIEFTDALSPHPLCCPARAEYLTGQYAHNNGVHHNTGPHGGYPALINKTDTIGTWLQESGYQTAFVGKFLNGYSQQPEAAAGWTRWNPSIDGTYSFNRTTFYNDGEPATYTSQADDVAAAFTRLYIKDFAKHPQPFFIWTSNVSPHIRATPQGWKQPLPSERHKNAYPDLQPPSKNDPAYLNPRKPVIPSEVEYGEVRDSHLTEQHRARTRSNLTIDDEVASIIATLKKTDELDNTIIMFTSDNGFMLGEHHRLGKNKPYEEAMRVPLLIRAGKDINPDQNPRATTLPATTTDITPTILDLADATPRRLLDGVSFAAAITGDLTETEQRWRNVQLIQAGRDYLTEQEAAAGDKGWKWRGVRTSRYTLAFTPTPEGDVPDELTDPFLIDRETDPYELINRAEDPAYSDVLQTLTQQAGYLFRCTGSSCSSNLGETPQPNLTAESTSEAETDGVTP